MGYVKKIGISLLYVIIPTLIVLLVLTILNYFGIINYSILNILKYITFFISIFIGAFKLGKNIKVKGWLEGLKLGILIITIFLLFNFFIFKTPFMIKSIVYYGLILGTSILGSVLGINKR